MSARARVTGVALLSLVSACRSGTSGSELARFRAAADVESYRVARVGVLPFGGNVDADVANVLASAFAGAFAREHDLDVRVLDARDLDGIPDTPTFERGWTRPETMIGLGRRFGLDAVLVGDVRRAQWFPPQRLDLSVDLVSVETGATLWSGSIDVDTGDQQARKALKSWYTHDRASSERGGWELCLVSPRLLAEFAAQVVADGY